MPSLRSRMGHDFDITEKDEGQRHGVCPRRLRQSPEISWEGRQRWNQRKIRANKGADTLNWIDAGSSAEVIGAAYSPGAASWATTAPRNPQLTLQDDEFLLAFRARMLLPIAPTGSTCAYRTSLTN